MHTVTLNYTADVPLLFEAALQGFKQKQEDTGENAALRLQSLSHHRVTGNLAQRRICVKKKKSGKFRFWPPESIADTE